jgi:hypothetical protein
VRRRAVCLLVCALVAAGCGAGAGDSPDAVRLTVTDGFGARSVVERPEPEVGGSDTVMRVLQRNAEVRTRFGGKFVHSIEGFSGGREGGRPVDWFFYVNGVLAEEGAAGIEVRGGDSIWWDRRDWGVTNRVAAVVGSFPEPFVHGIGGERLATRIDCDQAVEAACDAVQKTMTSAGVVAGQSLPGTEGGAESVRIFVGRWPQIRGDRAVGQIERGPKISGVFARLDEDGRTIEALDARGRAVRRLGPGSGLIAATRWRDEPPTWVVTGTDEAGVAAAARAFGERTLRGRFAVAIPAGGGATSLPVGDGKRID